MESAVAVGDRRSQFEDLSDDVTASIDVAASGRIPPGDGGGLDRQRTATRVPERRADRPAVGVARREKTHEEYREDCKEAIRRFSRRKPDEAVLQGLLEHVKYVSGVFSDGSPYAELEKVLDAFEQHAGEPLNRAFYLATHRERSRSPLAEAFRAFVEAEAV